MHIWIYVYIKAEMGTKEGRKVKVDLVGELSTGDDGGRRSFLLLLAVGQRRS